MQAQMGNLHRADEPAPILRRRIREDVRSNGVLVICVVHNEGFTRVVVTVPLKFDRVGVADHQHFCTVRCMQSA